MGFFRFFSGFSLCEFVIHWNKRHIFLCLFSLLTIASRDEAVIVELKEFFFEWHFYHLFRVTGHFVPCTTRNRPTRTKYLPTRTNLSTSSYQSTYLPTYHYAQYHI